MTSRDAVVWLCAGLVMVASGVGCESEEDGGPVAGTDSSGSGGAGGSDLMPDGGGGESGRDASASDARVDSGGGTGGTGGAGGNGGDAASNDDAGAQPDSSVDAGGGSGGDTMPAIVASGANHQLALSIDDGVTWCVTNSDSSMSDFDNPHLLRNVTFANGWFVSGSWRALFRSRNGYDWEDVTGDQDPALGNWIGQAAYGNGYWVAAGGYGQAMRSMDLMTWQDVSDELPGTEATRSLAFGNGVFVAGRDNVGWWQSDDGTAWTQLDPEGSSRVYFDGTAFQPHPGYDCAGELCLRANGVEISRSTDGADSWTPVATLSEPIERFAFGEAPAADFAASAAISAGTRACLGL